MRKCVLCHMRTKAQISPAHLPSLISAFVVRCLDSIISLDSIAEISRLVAQAGLCLAWSETHEDTFCRDVAHLVLLGLYGLSKFNHLGPTQSERWIKRGISLRPHSHLKQKNISVFQVSALKKLGIWSVGITFCFIEIFIEIAFFTTLSPIFQHICQYFVHNSQ